MTVDDEITNPTTNRPFEDILRARISRRGAIAGGTATGFAAFLANSGVAGAEDSSWVYDPKKDGGGKPDPGPKGSLLGFAAAPNPGGPNPVISDDYEWDVIIPWGSPLQPGGPDIDGGRPGSEAEALKQVGAGHDGMWFFPFKGSSEHGLLCINHEFGFNGTILGNEGNAGAQNLEQAKISQAVHGVSVIELKKINGKWQRVASRYNRRITPNTPVRFSGPARNSPLLKNKGGSKPLGTLNNCANGYTPWGTYLTCEENFNGYFGSSEGDAFEATEAQDRYGLNSFGFGYQWFEHDDRWDLSNPKYNNEHNRFGWIVEIDPSRPNAKPIKHTALGRFKHEGIALVEGKDGRMVGYMGDDQRFDYIYKFVGRKNWKKLLKRGKSPLAFGRLFVAKFSEDGTGEWIRLTVKNPVLGALFKNQAELLINTRLAADAVGATPMDRPEWTSVHPDGTVYCTLTNNTRRTEPGPANPDAPNDDGYVIRWKDVKQHTGTRFRWDFLVQAKDTRGTDYEFTDPDGLWIDPDGRAFIQTDGSQPNGNNQMVVADTKTGEIKRLFAGVADDEVTGVAITPDRRTMFINLQHPGNGDSELTNFPVPGAGGPEVPRDATIVITRKDGGIIGS